jgi:hypothetical protein
MHVNNPLQHPCGDAITAELAAPQLEAGVHQDGKAYTATLGPDDPDTAAANACKNRPPDHSQSLGIQIELEHRILGII